MHNWGWLWYSWRIRVSDHGPMRGSLIYEYFYLGDMTIEPEDFPCVISWNWVHLIGRQLGHQHAGVPPSALRGHISRAESPSVALLPARFHTGPGHMYPRLLAQFR